VIIPFPVFAPDKSVYDIGSSNNVVNALPVADGWGPMPSANAISESLGDECLGATVVRTASGQYEIVAGTRNNLFRLNTTNFTWTNINGPAGPYNVPLNDSWTMTRYGDQLVIHNLNDLIQVYDVGSGGVCSTLAGSPPRAKYSWVSGDFLVLGYLEGASGEKTVRWCGLNDIEHWTIGKSGSDLQVLPEGDEVMGGFGEQGGFTVIQRQGMQYFPFSPSSGFTFTRTVLNPKQGTLAPRSIVSIGPGRFFYLSEDGFFGGVERQPIGAERVDRWFLDQVDQTYLADVQGVADPFEKIVWWRYRVPNGTFNRLGYDWQLDRWCTTDLQVGEMVALTTPGITWDGLDAFYANIDAVNEPYDSRIFSGGRPTFATFTDENKLAYFTGSNLAATIDTAEVEIDSLSRSFVSGARVITDATEFTLQDGVRAFHGGPVTWSTANTANSRTGLVPFRSDGRLHQFRLNIPAAATWTIASAVNVNAQPSGGQ